MIAGHVVRRAVVVVFTAVVVIVSMSVVEGGIHSMLVLKAFGKRFMAIGREMDRR